MKKVALASLLALTGLSIASNLRNQTSTVVIAAPDVPPPSCSPNCPVQ